MLLSMLHLLNLSEKKRNLTIFAVCTVYSSTKEREFSGYSVAMKQQKDVEEILQSSSFVSPLWDLKCSGIMTLII